MAVMDRLQHAFNAFLNRDPTDIPRDIGVSYMIRPDRPVFSRGNDRTVITSIYNRIALDVASIEISHVKLDEQGRFKEVIKSGLQNCLNVEANIDQSGRAFRQDIAMSLLDEGCIAICPIDTDINPNYTSGIDIETMRVGRIKEWYPAHVKVEVYNDKTGNKEDLVFPKKQVAICENPFYAVMNETNSTLQRLKRKLVLLDRADENACSGKLDMIIQLPYQVRSQARKEDAAARVKNIKDQLSASEYGIAYTDATEKITQLNRPLENSLTQQVKDLRSELLSELSMTDEILNGTADEKAMTNYYKRTIEPIVACIVEEMIRKFLTKTARTQRQTITFFRDPFSLITVSDLANAADALIRNQVLTSNEVREKMGLPPSMDPKADELYNPNMPVDDQIMPQEGGEPPMEGEEPPMDGEEAPMDGYPDENFDTEAALQEVDDLDAQLDELENELAQSATDDPDAIQHYASKYYDPVKAHEYYEQHKHLKGRTSTSGLNDEGKSFAKMVKEQINTDRDNKIYDDKSRVDSQIDKLQDDKTTKQHEYTNAMQNEIDKIKDDLSRMSKADKARYADTYREYIAQLREENYQKKLELQNGFRSDRASLREEHRVNKTGYREDAKKEYENALDDIYSNPQYLKTSSSKKSSSKASSSTPAPAPKKEEPKKEEPKTPHMNDSLGEGMKYKRKKKV